jgi:hypothetical protein
VSEVDELGLLLSEKENADERISGYYQLQSTILGLALSGVVGFLGFVFTNTGLRTGVELTYILLALVAIASIAGLQATVFNGFALGYIHYKQEVLGPRFQELLRLKKNPLSAASDISRSPANKPIMIATRSLILAQALLGGFLFGGALCKATIGHEISGANAVPLIAGFIVSGTLLGGSIVAAIQFGKALDKVRNGKAQEVHRPHNPAPAADV